MDDNSRPRRAAIIDDIFEAEDIQRMHWSSTSPYLNPIEHAWDMLGRQLAARQHPPSSVPELQSTLHQS